MSEENNSIENQEQNIDDKLFTVKCKHCLESHLEIDREKCKHCKEPCCLYICPANVYSQEEDGTITAAYENCLECGACRIACNMDALNWKYPKGGYGITFKHG